MIPCEVWLFQNGNVAAFSPSGVQLPQYQGTHPEAAEKLKAIASQLDECQFFYGVWGTREVRPITQDEFFNWSPSPAEESSRIPS